jgi:uncharacterized membrane protein
VKKTTIALLFGLFGLVWAQPAWSSGYTVEQVNTHLYVNLDSSVDVVTSLTFMGSTKGSFLSFELPYSSSDQITHLTVSTGDAELAVGDEHHPLAQTYASSVHDDQTRILIFDPLSGDHRTYSISYTLMGAVNKYQDAADFVWLGTGNNKNPRIKNHSTTLHLPQMNDSGSVRVFARCSNPCQIRQTDNQSFLVTGDHPGKEYGLRAVFPSHWIQGEIRPELVLDQIMAEENARLEQQALQQMQDEQTRRYIYQYLLIAQPLIALLWFFFYLHVRSKLGRSIKFKFLPKYIKTAPAALKPALLPLLLNQQKTLSDTTLPATILDLCKKGTIKIEDDKLLSSGLMHTQYRYKPCLILKDKDYADNRDLEAFEKNLLSLVFDRIGKQNHKVYVETIQHFIKKNPAEFADFYKQFLDLLDSYPSDASAQTDHSRLWLARFWWVTGALLLLGSPVIVLGLILLPTLRKKSPGIEQQKKLWSNYLRFLKEIDRFDPLPPEILDHWEQGLIYALGANAYKPLLKTLPDILQVSPVQPVWYTLSGEQHFNTAMLSRLQQTLNQIIAAFAIFPSIAHNAAADATTESSKRNSPASTVIVRDQIK